MKNGRGFESITSGLVLSIGLLLLLGCMFLIRFMLDIKCALYRLNL